MTVQESPDIVEAASDANAPAAASGEVSERHRTHHLVWSDTAGGPVCLDCGNVKAFGPEAEEKPGKDFLRSWKRTRDGKDMPSTPEGGATDV